MIYMTTDEWHEISKLIEECDYYGLAEEIASRTYDLDISKQELDEIMKDYKAKGEKIMTRFVRVQGAGPYARYDVPTKEEYEGFIEKLREIREDFDTILGWR